MVGAAARYGSCRGRHCRVASLRMESECDTGCFSRDKAQAQALAVKGKRLQGANSLKKVRNWTKHLWGGANNSLTELQPWRTIATLAADSLRE